MITQPVRRIAFFLMLCGLMPALIQAQPTGLKPGDALVAADVVLFDLVNEQPLALGNVLGSGGTVVLFWSNQCPWTNRYRDRLQALMGDMEDALIQVVFVSSNDESVFPRERISASRAGQVAKPSGVYLRDDDAKLAVAFGAERTPDVFMFDRSRKLVYKGAIDDSPGDPKEVKTQYLADAVHALVQGRAPAVSETKPFGCQIKF